MNVRTTPAALLVLLLPAALVAYLSFNSGGYFPGATSFAALVLALVLIVRIVAAENPFAGLSVTLAVGAGALMLFAAWTLLSAEWSDASARALVEFDRVLLYLFAILAFGLAPKSPNQVRRMAWGLVAAIVAVCITGFLTRTLPDVFEIAPVAQMERLGYPIGYWNALGMLAGIGCVLCVHLTCSAREPRPMRVLGAAALPLLATTLLFTFARGPLVAVGAGLVAYLVLARPRLFLSGLLTAGPATGVALVAAYRADLLATKDPTTVAAAAQGHDVALAVAVCTVGAAVGRALLLWLDARLIALRVDRRIQRVAAGVVAALGIAALVVVVAGTDLTDRVEAQYERITRSDVAQTGDYRDRLTNPGLNRLDHWAIALDGYEDEPLRGQGAGTYALLWDRDRPTDSDSEQGHSLYLEVLSELGLVGLVLVGVALLALIVGAAARIRGRDRAIYAAVVAVALTWALHAGLDWDWEIPAVTLVVISLAAAACSAEPRPVRNPGRTGLPARIAAGLGCLALAATPALLAVSQARLGDALDAYEAGDCRTAVDEAARSLDSLGNRPEPYEILGWCYARAGRPRPAIGAMRAAVERDPDNWEYRYGLAMVRAAAGRDPRPAARAALRRNPREARVKEALARFRQGGPAAWRREAGELGLALR